MRALILSFVTPVTLGLLKILILFCVFLVRLNANQKKTGCEMSVQCKISVLVTVYSSVQWRVTCYVYRAHMDTGRYYGPYITDC